MKTSVKTAKRFPETRQRTGDGFTLIELLVVIAIIAVLAGMLMTSIARAKSTTQSVACLSNLKELQMSWAMYPHDNDDTLPPNKLAAWNFDSICPEGYENARGSWVMGNAMNDITTWNIQHGVLFHYNGATAIYHCPTDKSKVDDHPNLLRNRSYAMSYCMNGDRSLLGESFPRVKEKYSQLANASPTELFVFLDEAEQAIQDGVFFLHYPGDRGEQEAGIHWMDVPGDRHGRGCNLTFADGHAVRLPWKWTKKNAFVDQAPQNELDFQDLRKLQQFLPATP